MQDDPLGDRQADEPPPERIFGSDVDMTIRALLEVAAEKLGIGWGLARAEMEFDDGRLAILWTRRKHKVSELDGPGKTFGPPT
jgi:hypothetical protein